MNKWEKSPSSFLILIINLAIASMNSLIIKTTKIKAQVNEIPFPEQNLKIFNFFSGKQEITADSSILENKILTVFVWKWQL